jgi:ABC-type sugar transport system ATPase subunit
MSRDEFDQDRFIFAMSGYRLQAIFPDHEAPAATAPKMLEVAGLTVAGKPGAIYGARDVSFSVAEGEIVGLAGLLGSGRSEILHGVYGRVPAEGKISVGGREVAIRSPRDARAAGIALLTEDRKRDGLLFNLPVGANISIGNLGPLSVRGMVRPGAENNAILQAMRQLNVKASSPQGSVAHLSGGNQQKLLFARVLMRAPRVLLLDEPTKGVDAGTRHEIYKLVVELANKGVALVIVASELEEVLGLCDRCLTIADGRIVDEFRRGEGGEDRVLRAVANAQAQSLKAAS